MGNFPSIHITAFGFILQRISFWFSKSEKFAYLLHILKLNMVNLNRSFKLNRIDNLNT